jgi:hypothetical protein
MKFKNIHTQEIKRIDSPFLLTLLFGGFYFLFRGHLAAAVAYIICVVATAGISHLIFPFFAGLIVQRDYEKRGYVRI